MYKVVQIQSCIIRVLVASVANSVAFIHWGNYCLKNSTHLGLLATSLALLKEASWCFDTSLLLTFSLLDGNALSEQERGLDCEAEF